MVYRPGNYEPLIPSWFLSYSYNAKPAGLSNDFFNTPEIILFMDKILADENGLAAEKAAYDTMGWQKSHLWELAKTKGAIQEIKGDTIGNSVKKLFPVDVEESEKDEILKDKKNLEEFGKNFHSYNDRIAVGLERESNFMHLSWSRKNPNMDDMRTLLSREEKVNNIIFDEALYSFQLIPPLSDKLIEGLQYNMEYERPYLLELYIRGLEWQPQYFAELKANPKYMENSKAVDAHYEKHNIFEEFEKLIVLRKETEPYRKNLEERRRAFIMGAEDPENFRAVIREEFENIRRLMQTSQILVGFFGGIVVVRTIIEALSRIEPEVVCMNAANSLFGLWYFIHSQMKKIETARHEFPFGFLKSSARRIL